MSDTLRDRLRYIRTGSLIDILRNGLRDILTGSLRDTERQTVDRLRDRLETN